MKRAPTISAAILLTLTSSVASSAASTDECDWSGFDTLDPVGETRDFCTNENNSFVKMARLDFGIKDKHWGGDWNNAADGANTPLCLLLEGISILERSSQFAPSDRWLLAGGYDYTVLQISKLKPRCSYDDKTELNTNNPFCTSQYNYTSTFDSYDDWAEECLVEKEHPYARSGVTDGFEGQIYLATGLPFAYAFSNSTKIYQAMLEKDAASRASILLHEAAHRNGRTHNILAGGGEKDQRYQSAYVNDTPSVWSRQVDWLMDYIWLDENDPDIAASSRPVIDTNTRTSAAEYANQILDEFFLNEPGFRVKVHDVDDLVEASINGTSLVIQAAVFENSDYQNAATRTIFTPALAGEACGLTRVSGDLQHAEHMIWISEKEYPLTSAGGATITVQGLVVDNDTSIQSDKTIGHAQCFPGKQVDVHFLELSESDPNQSKVISPEEGRVCFLMGIKGKTEGEYERAQVKVVEGEWVASLRANNPGSEKSMEAKFGCIDASVRSVHLQDGNGFAHSEGFTPLYNYSDPDANPESVAFAYPFSCVLTEVHGRFRNENDVAVSISPCLGDPFGHDLSCRRYSLYVDEKKTLEGREVGGTMTCFDY